MFVINKYMMERHEAAAVLIVCYDDSSNASFYMVRKSYKRKWVSMTVESKTPVEAIKQMTVDLKDLASNGFWPGKGYDKGIRKSEIDHTKLEGPVFTAQVICAIGAEHFFNMGKENLWRVFGLLLDLKQVRDPVTSSVGSSNLVVGKKLMKEDEEYLQREREAERQRIEEMKQKMIEEKRLKELAAMKEAERMQQRVTDFGDF